MKQHDQLRKLKHQKEDYILKKFHNVVGVGVSKKHKNGKSTDKLALTVYVTSKISASSLAPDQNVKTDATVLQGLDSADDIDIKEIGVIKKQTLEQTKIRPVKAGISEGHYLITAGTGGPLVQNLLTKAKFRVSNNHVYANENKAVIGDPIYQPGPYDRGIATERVGNLASFIELYSNTGNVVDCALRTVQDDETAEVFNLNKIPTSIIEPEVGMSVVKMGRTTGVTIGTIEDIDLTISVEYDMGPVTFHNQVLITSDSVFSQGGDSGSGIYLDNGDDLSWVALLFAGSDDGNYTIANKASIVANALYVELYKEQETQQPEQPEPENPTEPEEPVENPKNKMLIIFGIGLVILTAITYIINHII